MSPAPLDYYQTHRQPPLLVLNLLVSYSLILSESSATLATLDNSSIHNAQPRHWWSSWHGRGRNFYQLLQASSRSPEPTTSAGPRAVIVRNCIDGHTRVMNNYFSNQPVHNDKMFQHCFWMSKDLFNHLCVDLQNHHCFWELKEVSRSPFFLFKMQLNLIHKLTFLFQDCCGQIGLSP